MKRVLFKQVAVSVLFACSLSADVPGVREQAGRGWLAEDRRQSAEGGGRTTDYASGAASLSRLARDGRTLRLSDQLFRTTPDFLTRALAVACPSEGFGINSMDRACVRWDVVPGVIPEAISVPTDPLDAAFGVPRYGMPLALQESAWPRPVGFWEPVLSPDVSVLSCRLDIDVMIPRLKKIFMAAGVPQKWVWVAQVESALNPRATSSAGAVGLFQLMPGTARRFGLQTTPVDDRMEPEKSAGAAAQYLKLLYQEFGCWSLALAAYNAGEGRVKEIMKKRKARTFDEVERYLPAETQAYVPKVMAAVALREDQLLGVPGAYWMP